jgi:hypothetical protein
MIKLEVPRKFGPLVAQARQVADEVFRPISRKYDREEHAPPASGARPTVMVLKAIATGRT